MTCTPGGLDHWNDTCTREEVLRCFDQAIKTEEARMKAVDVLTETRALVARGFDAPGALMHVAKIGEDGSNKIAYIDAYGFLVRAASAFYGLNYWHKVSAMDDVLKAFDNAIAEASKFSNWTSNSHAVPG